VTVGELGGLLCNYIDECVPHRMSARTAGAHLAAIKANFERSGRRDPTARGANPIVRNTLDGAARQYPVITTRCRPYTLEMLDALAELGTTRRRRAAAGAAIVGFFGALRGDELVPSSPGQYGVRNLAAKNVQVEWSRGRAVRARVRLASRKNMQIGTAAAQFGGAHIEFAAVDGGDPLDPVAWIVRVNNERVDARPGAPFFQRDDGSALARSDVESLVREAAGKVGEPQDRLTMHSGRAGMTTLLAAAGFDAAYIKEYGFWTSQAYEDYIRGSVFTRHHPQPHYVPDRNAPVAEVLRLRGIVIERGWA
jgi:hypothetical protein